MQKVNRHHAGGRDLAALVDYLRQFPETKPIIG